MPGPLNLVTPEGKMAGESEYPCSAMRFVGGVVVRLQIRRLGGRFGAGDGCFCLGEVGLSCWFEGNKRWGLQSGRGVVGGVFWLWCL